MPSSELTKNALAQAMKELMAERSMEKITVSDITERCFISRKSFYYHFKDKYDLVNWIYYTEFLSEMKDKDIHDWELVEQICKYFYKNRSFYGNALRVEGQNSFSDYFSEVLRTIIKDHLQRVIENNEAKDFFVTYFTDAIRIAITKWLLEDAKIPPDKFVNLMKTALASVAIKIVEDVKEN